MFLFIIDNCLLEYSLKVLRVAEPPLEDRMEQAFFNPSLSKQRVMFAIKHINESSAATLVLLCYVPFSCQDFQILMLMQVNILSFFFHNKRL